MNSKEITKYLFLTFTLVNSFPIWAMDVKYSPAIASHEIMERVFEKEKLSQQEEFGEDAEAERRLKIRYDTYEKKLHTLPKGSFRFEPAGNLDYLMTKEELEKTIREKFRTMYDTGQIITEDAFQKRDQKKWLKPGKLGSGATDLPRIWGAEYLARKFSEGDKNSQFKVPAYILVVKDLKNIDVGVDVHGCYPRIASIKNNTGTIYAQKIDGKPATLDKHVKDKVGHGYVDYSDAENILKTADGDYYVVDTELKSFEDQNKELRAEFCDYLKNRFGLLNSVDTDTKYPVVKVSVGK